MDREKFQPNSEKRAAFRERYGIDEDEWMVLTVAQQTPRKGIYDFLALSHEHQDIRFVWVGGFPYGRFSQDHSLIEERKNCCGENVLFTGFVDDITAAYCSADVFFIPSSAEGLPMVALEAFATVFRLSPGGSLSSPRTLEILPAIARSIEEAGILLKDRNLLEQHASLARPFTERYDIRAIANLHIDLYRELAG